jgi:cysteine desulfurase
MRTVYLDNNATTPVLPGVIEAMQPYLSSQFGNPSSIYERGQNARHAVEKARESVSRLLACSPAEVVFTSGGTESDNLAILGTVKSGDHVITSAVEHSAVLRSASFLRGLTCEVTVLPVDAQGRVNPDDVRRALRPNTRLISIMMANNETGVLQPVEDIGKIAADAGVLFHTDAVQAAGKVPISVENLRCDLLSMSGHKIHGPQGIGALFVRRGTSLRPLLHGGHQERGLRAGTENVPGIVGLGRACELAERGLRDGTLQRIAVWRDRFEASVNDGIEAAGINGGNVPRVPNTSNIYFDYIKGEALVLALDLKGISASSGAACSAGSGEPSHVMLAMGLSNERAQASLRFSIGKQNTVGDVEYVMETLPDTVQSLRDISPVYKRRLHTLRA